MPTIREKKLSRKKYTINNNVCVHPTGEENGGKWQKRRGGGRGKRKKRKEGRGEERFLFQDSDRQTVE